MRRRNWRFVIAGLLLAAMAAAFFVIMLGMVGRSTDPAEFMRLVGQISGGVIGLSLAMILIGLIGKKA